MKNVLMLIVGVILAFGAKAQYDPKAKTVLDAMSAKYKDIPAYKANIKYSIQNKLDDISEHFEGSITVSRDMFWLKLDEQEIINNGKTVWTYLPEINEVTMSDFDPEEDELLPSKIYSEYTNGYKYILVGSKTIGGESCDEIDLIPEKAKDKQIFKIKLFISKKTKTLKEWSMHEKSGNIYVYQISKFDPSVKVSDNFFVFDVSKYPGIEVVNLN